MIKKYLTCKTILPPDDEYVIAARLDHDEENRNILHTVYERAIPRHYMTGEIATRLYEYEQFGYTPEELKEIIKRDKTFRDLEQNVQLAMYKHMVNSAYGASAALGRLTASCQNHDGLRAKVTLIDEMHMVEPDEYMTTTKWPKKNPHLPKTDNFEIEKVIFNDPATIVLWKDGTKTVVKAENEKFDPEKGLAMAISRKALGNKGNYFETFKKWVPKKKTTYREKLKAEHPDKVGASFMGGCCGCPSDYGYGPESLSTCFGASEKTCAKCWDTVIEGGLTDA